MLATCQIFHGGTLRRYVGTQPWQNATPRPPTITNSGPPPLHGRQPTNIVSRQRHGRRGGGVYWGRGGRGGERRRRRRRRRLPQCNIGEGKRPGEGEGGKGQRGADDGPARAQRQDQQSGKEGGRRGRRRTFDCATVPRGREAVARGAGEGTRWGSTTRVSTTRVSTTCQSTGACTIDLVLRRMQRRTRRGWGR